MGDRIKSYRDLRVCQNAMEAAMEIFELTKGFPPEEKYSMVDQMRRSSRSLCTNIAESWRKRRYGAAFIAKLSDAESEACEPRFGSNSQLDVSIWMSSVQKSSRTRMNKLWVRL